MTLVVSARIPDGVVIGVDSLSTIGGTLNIAMDAKFKCKACQTENEVKSVQVPPLQFPVSTKGYAQKLFRFKDKYAIGCFGNAFVNQKSVQRQIRSLEAAAGPVSSVDAVAEKVFFHFEKELKQEVTDLNKLPPNFVPFGFQVVGYDMNEVGKTWVIQMGRTPTKIAEEQLGITFSGDIGLIQNLLQATGSVPALQPNLMSFSLQDAVDFVQFLIKFVADYQRFANMIPTVGGDIDVALVTSYSGLKWIRRKSLAQILEQEIQEVTGELVSGQD